MTASLDEIAARFRNGGNGGAAVGGGFEVWVGQLARALALKEREERELWRAVQPCIIPAVQFPIASGVVSEPVAASLLGPEDGQVWDMRRVSVDGLQGAAAGLSAASQTAPQTNPAANAVIAQITAAQLAAIAPVGTTWQVSWTVSLQGTVTSADANNMHLTSPLGTQLVPGMFPGTDGNYPQPAYTFVPGSGAINVQAVAAASGAAAIYAAQITAVPLLSGDLVRLYREIVNPAAGNTQNRLHAFTADGTSPGADWQPGAAGCMLRSPEGLIIAGSDLVATALTLSGEGVAIEQRWISRYLI